MTRHYLDHASTSPARPGVVRALEAWSQSSAGDPSRLHAEGRAVRATVEDARTLVAELLGTRPRQVIFTSGATEAVNAAVWGAARARPGRPIVLGGIEHSCVVEASLRTSPVSRVSVTRDGTLDLASLEESLRELSEDGAHDEGAALVHCQLANHEVGTLQPVAEVVELARRFGAWVHVDAAAAAGHVPLSFDDLGADFLSVSAHKFGGPPGTGALLVRRGLRVDPFVVGGEQERLRRAGLENVPGIAGFGAAAASILEPGQLEEEAREARRLTRRLADAALAVDGVRLLGSALRVPHLVALSIAGVEAEPVLLGLDQAGIAAHSGSSCSSESLAPSPVLEAMGEDAERSLRLSVGWSTSDEDVEAFAAAFPGVVERLRALGSSGG